jgi:hypothetical protein
MTQGFSGRSRGRFVTLLATILIVAIAISQLRFRAPASPLPEIPDHPTLNTMLRASQPELRAAAAVSIGRQRQLHFVPALITRMSDDDWRVRAAAFTSFQQLAADKLHLPGIIPLRDTPVDEREQLLFSWITSWRNVKDSLPALPQLCELYATNEHWLTGTVLAEACLTCHAPKSADTYESSQRCASCHQQAHATWSSSAHALSITHLPLARVDPKTKQVAWYDYQNRSGLVCISCHTPATSNVAPTAVLPKDHHFIPVTAATCVSCHSETNEQWQRWGSSPRPTLAAWPPGEIKWSASTAPQTCITCHMPRNSSGSKTPSHNFSARRNLPLLQQGLHVAIEPATLAHPAQLVLINLSGHAYPAGTSRRELAIEITYDDDPATRQVLARFADTRVPATQPSLAPLEPCEQRRIDLPTRSGASRITCRIIYRRNRFDAGAFELPLHELTASMALPRDFP